MSSYVACSARSQNYCPGRPSPSRQCCLRDRMMVGQTPCVCEFVHIRGLDGGRAQRGPLPCLRRLVCVVPLRRLRSPTVIPAISTNPVLGCLVGFITRPPVCELRYESLLASHQHLVTGLQILGDDASCERRRPHPVLAELVEVGFAAFLVELRDSDDGGGDANALPGTLPRSLAGEVPITWGPCPPRRSMVFVRRLA
jgi:hypothetical protein